MNKAVSVPAPYSTHSLVMTAAAPAGSQPRVTPSPSAPPLILQSTGISQALPSLWYQNRTNKAWRYWDQAGLEYKGSSEDVPEDIKRDHWRKRRFYCQWDFRRCISADLMETDSSVRLGYARVFIRCLGKKPESEIARALSFHVDQIVCSVSGLNGRRMKCSLSTAPFLASLDG